MATQVKIIPTLHGEAARMFLDRAEALERRWEELRLQGKNPRPVPTYNEREEQAYIKMMKESGMPL